ncbi:4-alpha-glucanotransferase, partial [Mycobacterium tuberculosis]|nr:4-alpha-glucanotransferase [Mycobacterium tuberculosis]
MLPAGQRYPLRRAEQQHHPFRALLHAALRHAAALRTDHLIGLFRLWWLPDGG